MRYLWQWQLMLIFHFRSQKLHEKNFMCTACRELYFQTIQEGSLEFIFVCVHEYICLLSFGTSCAFSTWRYKNIWGTPWSPAGIPTQSGFRGDGKFDSEMVHSEPFFADCVFIFSPKWDFCHYPEDIRDAGLDVHLREFVFLLHGGGGGRRSIVCNIKKATYVAPK